MLATCTPMAPRPMTPRFLPEISGPTNWLLPFSTTLATSSPARAWAFTHSTPPTTSREASIRAHTASSLTALALAPGVLNTTMPFSEQRSMGMLLVPAPARAMARRAGGKTYSCMSAERTRTPSSFSTPSETVKREASSTERPVGLI